jgi:flagellar protein FliO/FliZ
MAPVVRLTLGHIPTDIGECAWRPRRNGALSAHRFVGNVDMSWLFWVFILLLLAAAGAAAFWAYRVYVVGETSFNVRGLLFRPRAEPRLGISEQAAVDSRRRLVLVRRDNVEHLIMTGGPVDVVIETGIAVEPRVSANGAADEPAEPPPLSPPVFKRAPRSFGQAVNE